MHDIANLLAICDIRDLNAAEGVLNDFYLGDQLPDKARRLLGPIFKQGLPPVRHRHPLPEWGRIFQISRLNKTSAHKNERADAAGGNKMATIGNILT